MSKKMVRHSLEFDFIVCGVEIQNPYNGKNLTLHSQEIEYQGKLLRNCIRIRYHIFVSRDITVSEQEFINTVVVREQDLFLQVFTLLLCQPSQILVHKASLDGEVAEPKFPPQNLPGLYNLISLWDCPSTNYRYTSLVHDDGWPLLETLSNTARTLSSKIADSISLPLRWFSKGANETNSLDRLVAFWICFNAIYQDQEKPEIDAIKNWIDNYLDKTVAERFIKQNRPQVIALSNFPIELGRKRKQSIAQELGELLRTNPQDYLDIAKVTILTIYGVRNSLFHGDCNTESTEDRMMIGLSERLLSKLMKEIISMQIFMQPLPHNKFVIPIPSPIMGWRKAEKPGESRPNGQYVGKSWLIK